MIFCRLAEDNDGGGGTRQRQELQRKAEPVSDVMKCVTKADSDEDKTPGDGTAWKCAHQIKKGRVMSVRTIFRASLLYMGLHRS